MYFIEFIRFQLNEYLYFGIVTIEPGLDSFYGNYLKDRFLIVFRLASVARELSS